LEGGVITDPVGNGNIFAVRENDNAVMAVGIFLEEIVEIH
jgi:hypothetical protein